MNLKQKFRKNQGITLIALVVTIIVLLILAGITIAMLTGQNGILNRATEAKDSTGTAQVDEEVKLSVAEALSNGLGTMTEENLRKALDENVGAGNYELTGDTTNGWTIKAGDKTYNISGNGSISGGDNTGGNTSEDNNTTGGGNTAGDNTTSGGTTGGNTGDKTEEVDETLYIDDSYVDYNVSYTDIYTGTKYTNLTGWRVLNKVDNGDGTSNLDIISTGIPAGVYYNFCYIKSTTYSPWAGTADDITKYVSRYYTSGSKTNENMYAVSGLRYKFEKIKFKKQTGRETSDNNEYGSGYYTEISKNGTAQTGEIDGTTFKARNNVEEVRSVIHSDITGDEKSSSITVTDPANKKGLFILQNYTPDKHTNSLYWLASPDPSFGSDVYYVYCNGSVTSLNSSYIGVRPVVSMTNVKMQRKAGNSHVWEIVD